jgi:hypothetical protein
MGSFVVFFFFFLAYVELLRVFLILWREILECSPYPRDKGVHSKGPPSTERTGVKSPSGRLRGKERRN